MMEDPQNQEEQNLRGIRLFTEALNRNGEVTPEKRQGWDLVKAYANLHEQILTSTGFDESSITNFHGILSAHIPFLTSSEKGQYALGTKKIENAQVEWDEFTKPEEILERMKRLGGKFERYMRYHPEEPKDFYRVIENAAEIMVELIDVHPFSNGNGRTSRLLADAILMTGDLYQMPHWINPDVTDQNKAKLDFIMMVEQARRGYSAPLLYFMASQQRIVLEQEIVAINSSAEAQIEAQKSGYLDERTETHKFLAEYEELLTNSMRTDPPSAHQIPRILSSK